MLIIIIIYLQKAMAPMYWFPQPENSVEPRGFAKVVSWFGMLTNKNGLVASERSWNRQVELAWLLVDWVRALMTFGLPLRCTIKRRRGKFDFGMCWEIAWGHRPSMRRRWFDVTITFWRVALPSRFQFAFGTIRRMDCLILGIDSHRKVTQDFFLFRSVNLVASLSQLVG